MTWKTRRINRRKSPTFDTWHGTRHEFEEFDISKCELGVHSGSYSQALYAAGGGRIIPLKVELKNPMRLIDKGSWTPEKTWKQAVDRGYVKDPGNRFAKKISRMIEKNAEAAIRERFMGAGYDGIVYLNRYDDIPTEAYHEIIRAEDESNLHTSDEEILAIYPGAHDSYIAFESWQIRQRDA